MTKKWHPSRQYSKGTSTIEIMVAFVVITLAITAVIMVSFGGQSLALDTELGSEALYKAEQQLEEAFASARGNFLALASTAAVVDDIYSKYIDVSDIDVCAKLVTSTVTWEITSTRPLQRVDLTSVYTDLEAAEAAGGDCNPVGLGGGWDNPTTQGSVDLIPGGNKGTGIDVIKDGGSTFAFLTSETGAGPKPDFWAINATDATSPVIVGSLDVGKSLNDVDVAGGYAYVASASTTAQFQVIEIDLADPLNVGLTRVAARGLNGVDPLGSYPGAISIRYYDGKVYVGTLGTDGPEFHVFDVSADPTNPTELGNIELARSVHEVAVSGDFAYLATSDNSRELMVVDISNPGSMEHPNVSGFGFDAVGPQDGKSVYVLGNKVYLGRDRAGASHDFLILDAGAVRDGSDDTDGLLGSKDLNLNPNTAVAGIVVRGQLAFLATTHSTAGFQVWNVSDPSNISAPSACNVYNYSEKATAIDFVDDLGFVANESNDALRIIRDNPTSCSP